jgi:hypothetical protein
VGEGIWTIRFKSIRADFSRIKRILEVDRKVSNSPKQARQEPDPKNTPEQRSADGDDRVRDHVRQPD